MTYYRPPHEAKDDDKLAGLVEAFRTGQTVPPIVVQGDYAITGSHRIAAHEIARERWEQEAEGWENSPAPKLAVVEVDNETWNRACQMQGVEHLDELDCSDACQAIYDATTDDAVKEALEDQLQ